MANFSVKKGDNVVVITGKDKGKVGKVLKVNTASGRIYVEGVNLVHKSRKPRSAQEKGGIIEQEGTIDVSNVMHICSGCGAAIRVKHELRDVNGKQKSVRVCPKCGIALDEKKQSAKRAARKVAKKKAEKNTDNKADTKVEKSKKESKKD